MKDNRIDQVSVAQTGHRQTPKNEFGEVLVKTSREVVSAVAPLLGGFVTGPIMTAAVSGVTAVTGLASRSTSGGSEPSANLDRQTQTLGGGGGAVGGSTSSGQSEAMELFHLNAAMQAEGFKMNGLYMNLQREMQRESREFTTLSNIMKVRHDTAKSAINNVR